MIHRFRIQNFKSIVDVTVDLSQVTVLVGRSGTGKSNFVASLRALRDSISSPQSSRNLQQRWDEYRPAVKTDAPTRFELEFSIEGVADNFTYALAISKHGPQVPPTEEFLKLGDKTLFHQQSSEQNPHAGDWIVEPDLTEVPANGEIALRRIPAISDVVIAYTALTEGIGCYLFPDTVLSSGASQNAASGLNDDALNYLSTLKEIVRNLQDLNVRKNMLAALQRVNPSISSVELDDIQDPKFVVVGHRYNGKTVALKLAQESDGFRRFYAHLLALYQRPPKQTLIFEHPEDGIHPGALALLAEEFKAAPSDGRGQIILTTHSPKLLDYFDADQIRVVELDGLQTRIGPLASEQRTALEEDLLDAGELLTVDPGASTQSNRSLRGMKRIVLFVEGEGEEKSLRGLVGKLLSEQDAWDVVYVDDRAFRMGQVNKLIKRDFKEWKRKVQAALMRSDVGGILLLLDGDIKSVGGKPFCAKDVARSLSCGGGQTRRGHDVLRGSCICDSRV